MARYDEISRRQFVKIGSGVAAAGVFAGLFGCAKGPTRVRRVLPTEPRLLRPRRRPSPTLRAIRSRFRRRSTRSPICGMRTTRWFSCWAQGTSW
ncbi:MAG: twin-arginine translocation signal domain-containing protein [Slackia sp.]|nr:twin-arginine translocation signal domain-containing protein [Slackia sp.]